MSKGETEDMRSNDAYGRTFGLATARGIALLQIVEHTALPKEEREVRLMRVCDGFVEPGASEESIRAVLERPERFFLLTAIHVLTKQSRIYRQFFAFDGYYDVPRSVRLPKYLRGYMVDSQGNVRWYRRRRTGCMRLYVRALTKGFLRLSPDSIWSLPDLREFLEAGKRIEDYR